MATEKKQDEATKDAKKPAAKSTKTTKTAAKSTKSTAEKSTTKATTKAGAKPAAKSATKSTKSAAAGSTTKSADKTVAKTAAKSVAKPETKAASAGAAKKDSKAKAVKEDESGILRLHHLRPAPGAKRKKQRVGRGEGSKGKTAGRGTKGTKARYQVKAGFEGGQMPLHMRLPKLRGFKNPFRKEYQVVNLERLSELFPEGGSLGVEDLVSKGAVRKGQLVKVLGDGEVTQAFNLTVDAWSASAKTKIEAAGGSLQKR